MKARKSVILAVVIAGGIFFLFFWLFGERATVGILLPKDDVFAHVDARIGFLAAMKTLPSDVRFVDVDYTSTTLKNAIEKAAHQGIKYFVADNYSSDLANLDDVLKSTHSILIEDMVTNPNVLKNIGCAFTLSPTDDVQASAIASYIKTNGYTSIVLVKDITDSEYVDYLASQIRADLKGVKCEEVYTNDLKEVKKAPALFVLITSPNDAVSSMKALKTEFPNSDFLGSDWTFSTSLFDEASTVNGLVTVGFVDPIYLKTKASYIAGLNLPMTPGAILSYNALKVAYILAKERVRCSDAERYLENHSFFGITGTFTFDGVHATTPVYFYRITSAGLKLAWEFGD